MSSAATDPPSAAAVGAAPTPVPVAEPSVAPGLSERALVAITAALALPIFWLGYGTDIDVGQVLLAGDRIRNGDYAPSRNPGVPVVETIVGLLDPVGGHILVNLATVGALAFTVVGIARLVRAWGHDNGDLVALALLVSPVTLIAGTSTGDFIWALAFFVWGALMHLQGRSVLAGVLFGLAIGSRSTTLLLVAAFLLADGWDRAHRRRCLTTAALALPLGAAFFIPSWLSYHRTFEFLTASRNEAADVVHWRIATPSDVDLAMTKGVNYPRGPLAWGNELGLHRVLGEIDRLRDETEDERYRPSPLLRRMVKEGRRFFE